jgi:hypothetical protein
MILAVSMLKWALPLSSYTPLLARLSAISTSQMSHRRLSGRERAGLGLYRHYAWTSVWRVSFHELELTSHLRLQSLYTCILTSVKSRSLTQSLTLIKALLWCLNVHDGPNPCFHDIRLWNDCQQTSDKQFITNRLAERGKKTEANVVRWELVYLALLTTMKVQVKKQQDQ